MTTQEQEAVIGRTVRDVQSLRGDVAVANRQLLELADFLRELSDELRERIPAPKENGQPIEIPSHICRLVDFSKMFALIADRDKVFRKLGEAEKSLKQMGLSP